jgi:hypothetical protein
VVAAPAGGPSAGTFESTFNGATADGAWSLFVYDDDGTNASGSVTGGWCLDITQASGAATTTTVTTAPNPSLTGVGVSVTATVKSGGNAVNAAGTVTFTENGQNVAGGPTSPVSVNSSGQASFSTTALPEGDHNILATYNGVADTYALSFGSKIQRVDSVSTSSTSSGVISYCNPGATTIPSTSNPTDLGPANPNPSNIFVTDAPGTINHISVSLNGIQLSSPYYLTSLLVGPLNTTANSLDFFSDVGGATPMSSPVNVTLDDDASSGLTVGNTGSALTTGSFKPTSGKGNDTFAGSDTFFTPPSGPYQYAAPIGDFTLGQLYDNQNPNGTWSLYLYQDNQATGSTIGSWCVNLTENLPTWSIAKSHVGDFAQSGTGSYTITVTNNGPDSTGGTTTVTDNPPTGMSLTGLSGTNWSCSSNSCTRSDALGQGVSYDTITATVSIASNAGSSLTNSATVSGGGASNSPTATDPTTILAATTTAAANQSAGYSTGDQTVGLTATVSSGGAVNSGTVTFAVFNGGTQIGSSVTSGTVTSGSASANYTLPGGTGAGTYTIEATYNPGPAYVGSSDSSHTLTVNAVRPTISWTPVPTIIFGDAGTSVLNAGASCGACGSFTYSATPTGGGSAIDISAGTATLAAGSYNVTANFTPGSANYAANSAQATLVVSGESVWILNSGAGGTSELAGNGAGIASSADGGANAAVAIDHAGNVWSVGAGPVLEETSQVETVQNTINSGGGLDAPAGIAIDGNGQVWVTNGNNTVSLFSNAGAPISASGGIMDSSVLATPTGIAVDLGGSVWIANAGSNSVTRILGAAAPTAPLSTAAANNTTGAKP